MIGFSPPLMELSYRRITGRTRSGRSWRGFSIGANLSVSRWEIPSCCEAEWRVQDMKAGTVEWFDLVFFGPYFHSTGTHTLVLKARGEDALPIFPGPWS